MHDKNIHNITLGQAPDGNRYCDVVLRAAKELPPESALDLMRSEVGGAASNVEQRGHQEKGDYSIHFFRITFSLNVTEEEIREILIAKI